MTTPPTNKATECATAIVDLLIVTYGPARNAHVKAAAEIIRRHMGDGMDKRPRCSGPDCNEKVIWQDAVNGQPIGGSKWCHKHAICYRAIKDLVPYYTNEDLNRSALDAERNREKETA